MKKSASGIGISPENKISNLKLLIAEDDPTLQMLWRSIIESWNLPIELTIVGDGGLALDHLAKNKPDLIITDLDMPNTDGRILIKSVSENPLYRDIRIVITSGNRDMELSATPLVIATFEKPVFFDNIQRLIKNQLEHFQSLS